MFLVFTSLFYVFFKSQLSCAMTGESELSLWENISLYHDEKKNRKEKTLKNQVWRNQQFLGSLTLFLTCTVDDLEIISRNSLLVKALLPTEGKYH